MVAPLSASSPVMNLLAAIGGNPAFVRWDLPAPMLERDLPRLDQLSAPHRDYVLGEGREIVELARMGAVEGLFDTDGDHVIRWIREIDQASPLPGPQAQMERSVRRPTEDFSLQVQEEIWTNASEYRRRLQERDLLVPGSLEYLMRRHILPNIVGHFTLVETAHRVPQGSSALEMYQNDAVLESLLETEWNYVSTLLREVLGIRPMQARFDGAEGLQRGAIFVFAGPQIPLATEMLFVEITNAVPNPNVRFKQGMIPCRKVYDEDRESPGPLSELAHRAGNFPLDLRHASREDYKDAVHALSLYEGLSLLLPATAESMRSQVVPRIRPHAAALAVITGHPVVPVLVEGLEIPLGPEGLPLAATQPVVRFGEEIWPDGRGQSEQSIQRQIEAFFRRHRPLLSDFEAATIHP